MVKNLKTLRSQKGVSQKQLAEKIGVSQQSINKYENHSIEPDIDILIRLADYFDVSIDYLVGYSDVKQKAVPTQFFELNDPESTLLTGYRNLSPKKKRLLQLLTEIFLDPTP